MKLVPQVAIIKSGFFGQCKSVMVWFKSQPTLDKPKPFISRKRQDRASEQFPFSSGLLTSRKKSPLSEKLLELERILQNDSIVGLISQEGENDMSTPSMVSSNEPLIGDSFSEVSVGLVSRYAKDQESLSSEEKLLVEGWIEKYPHVQENIDYLRKNARFFKGVVMTYSDI